MSARDDMLDQRIKRIVSADRTTKSSFTCPEESRIVLYCEDGLTETEREVMENHFVECDLCLNALIAYSSQAADDGYKRESVSGAVKKNAKSLTAGRSFSLAGALASFMGPLWNRWTPVWAAPLLLILLLPVFWFAAKPAIEEAVVARTQKVLGEHGVAIKGLDIGWRSVLVKGLTLAEGDKKVLSIGDATFEFELKDLLDGEVVISRLTMDSPQFSAASDKSGGFTFKGLNKADLSVFGDTPIRFESSTIVMNNASFNFTDSSVNSKPVTIDLVGVSLTANNFNYPAAGKPTFQIQGQVQQSIDPGSFFITGATDTATGNLNLNARFENIDLTLVASYLKDRIVGEIKSGLFDMEVTLNIRNKKVETVGACWLKDLTVTDISGTFFGVPIPQLMDMMAVQAGGVKVPFDLKFEAGMDRELLAQEILDSLETGLRSALNS